MGQQQSSRPDDVERSATGRKESLKMGALSLSGDEEPDGQDHLSANLRKAAAAHDVDEVNEWLSKRADPTKCDKMGRNALHHACRHEVSKETNVEQMITLLLKKGCDQKINATDSKDHTALYYAIKYRNGRAAVKLVEGGADFETRAKEQGNTELHEACLAGLVEVVEKMLYYAPPSSPRPVDWKGHKNATPLHAACKNSNLRVVKMLLDKDANIFAEDGVGKTPLHAAASGLKVRGTIETVDYLLKCGAMKILNKASLDTPDEESKTPLSTACFYGQHETVKFLLSKGAVVDTKCMKYAVENDFSYTARALVRSSQWKKCLRTTLPSGEPILNEIIRRWPEVAFDVLDKCTVRRLQTYDETGRVAFNFEFLECFCEKTASFQDESLAQRQEYVDDPANLAKHHAKKDIAQGEKEFEDVTKQRKTWFGPQWGLKIFRKSHHPLSVIVKSGDERLLTHPVVRALLHYKWMHFGFGYYLANLIFFLLFLVFATTFSLSVGNPLSPECPVQGNGTCNFTERRKDSVISLAFFTIVFAAIRLAIRILKEIILMFKLRWKYFTNIFVLFDWMDVPSYLLIIVFAVIFHYDCPCPQEWQWQVGIIGLFLAWLTLLKFANKFPVISKYVLMLGKIIETFGKVAFTIGIPLVIAFAWPFYMALYDPDVLRSPFQNAAIAIAKVLSMTTGNFDYDETFRRDLSMESEVTELPYLPATYILWITFIILMPLLLNNLLVGLAIGDIKSVEEKAERRKLKLKVELVLESEELLPSYFRSRWRCGHRVVSPWKQQRIDWLRPGHESPASLEPVLERTKHLQNQARTQTTKYGKDHQVKHSPTARVQEKKYEPGLDIEARFERLEDILESITIALNNQRT